MSPAGKDVEPSLEEILAYQAGALEGSRKEQVRRALAAEPELAKAASELADPEALASSSGLDDRAVDAAWALFEARLGVSHPEPRTRRSPRSSPGGASLFPDPTLRPRRSMRLARTGFAMAASFVLGLVAASWWDAMSEAPGSGGGVLYESLVAEDRDGPWRGLSPGILDADAAEWLVLELQPPSVSEAELPQEAEMSLLLDGRVIRSGTIQLQDEGVYVVFFRCSELAPGSYRIELAEEGGGPFVRYGFRWRRGDPEGARPEGEDS